MDITFGPVPSRRLGRSLGINNILPKHCSYSCVYCQVGPTHGTAVEPRPFHSPAEIRRQVAQRRDAARKQGEKIDWLTFVPGGEPTLDSRLGEAIDALRDLGLPIAVISNASLISREEVRAAPGRADGFSVIVDSTDASAWRRINRRHPEGIPTFSRRWAGTLVSETMLVAGVNGGEAAIENLGRHIAGSGIARAYRAVPTRPRAVASTHGPDAAVATRAYQQLESRGVSGALLTGDAGEDFAGVGDFGQELLAMTAVHPLRESALQALAEKSHGDMRAVTELPGSGQLRRVRHQGGIFCIRHLRTT